MWSIVDTVDLVCCIVVTIRRVGEEGGICILWGYCREGNFVSRLLSSFVGMYVGHTPQGVSAANASAWVSPPAAAAGLVADYQGVVVRTVCA